MGFGTDAPGNAGFTVIGPCTTAHELRCALLFVHVTRTRQCSGTVTVSSPRPYPSKLKPLFDES